MNMQMVNINSVNKNVIDWMYRELWVSSAHSEMVLYVLIFSFHWDNWGKKPLRFHYYHYKSMNLIVVLHQVSIVNKTQKLDQVVLHKVWFKAPILDTMNHIKSVIKANYCHKKLWIQFQEPKCLIFSMIWHIFSSRFFGK